MNDDNGKKTLADLYRKISSALTLLTEDGLLATPSPPPTAVPPSELLSKPKIQDPAPTKDTAAKAVADCDLNHRPGTYWDCDAVQANIKGQVRRALIDQAIRSGEAGAIPPVVFADKLPDWVRTMVGQLHPQLMGGEYLPEYSPGEIEIARLSLRSTTSDVITLTARLYDGRIRYRWREEYEDESASGTIRYVIPEGQAASMKPLSLGELVELIRSTTRSDYQCPESDLIKMFRDDLVMDGSSAEEAAAFMSMSSEFYPALQRWYDDDSARWLANLAKQDEEDSGDKPSDSRG